jgi:hypothetical protein
MIPYVILVLLLLFYSNRKNYIAIMVILTVFAVVRYDVGWDYMTYYNIAKDPETTIDYQRFSFVWHRVSYNPIIRKYYIKRGCWDNNLSTLFIFFS